MKIRFNKGDNIVATNSSTMEQFSFTCPTDGMCRLMLKRYVVMKLEKPLADYIFTKQ